MVDIIDSKMSSTLSRREVLSILYNSRTLYRIIYLARHGGAGKRARP
jgi:hypothetical protein